MKIAIKTLKSHITIFVDCILTLFLPGCGCVSTFVWMHHSNETHAVKARLELRKNDTCRREQILEAASDKPASARPVTFHPINHPSKTSKRFEHR